MDKTLPVFKIEGTAFFVDVNNMALREKNNPGNIILIADMNDSAGQGYRFDYDRKEKNIPGRFSRHADMIQVQLPDLVVLDPEGMAGKYGLSMGELKGMTDFDLMVDPKAYALRVKQGRLPEVDIAGWTFYVDLRMDRLRPRDDFMSEGIVFSDIDHLYEEENNRYVVPYNKKTHEAALDWDFVKAVSIPKEVLCISFPHESQLDRIGWNRLHGRDLNTGLKIGGIRSHFKAGVIPWLKTGIYQTIRENRIKAAAKPGKDHGQPPSLRLRH